MSKKLGKLSGRNITIKRIKQFAYSDFGVFLADSSAEEIAEDLRNGCATWASDRYISTVTNHVTRMSSSGVVDCTAFYSRKEWNEQHRATVASEKSTPAYVKAYATL